MARVGCIMMQKNETDLLQPWVDYHAYLFGKENLFVFDNGSDDPENQVQLVDLESSGLSVDRSYPRDFERKGEIIGNKIQQLEQTGRYDFLFPMDCDEFLVLQNSKTDISCSRERIHAELEALQGDQAFAIVDAYFNIIGHRDQLWCWEMDKTFFRAGTFGSLDHGHHHRVSRLQPGKSPTRFAFMHFHHKPYDLLVAHSRAKLAPFVDVDDAQALAEFRGCGWHLTKYLLEPPAVYERRFVTSQDSVALPQFRAQLDALGVVMPFDRAATTGDE